MNKALAHYISLGIGLGAIGVVFPAQAASFHGLGDLQGGSFHSEANAIGSPLIESLIKNQETIFIFELAI